MNKFSLSLISLIALGTNGCTNLPIVVSDYCSSYERITASRKDTTGTLRQVLRENSKYEAACPKEVPK